MTLNPAVIVGWKCLVKLVSTALCQPERTKNKGTQTSVYRDVSNFNISYNNSKLIWVLNWVIAIIVTFYFYFHLNCYYIDFKDGELNFIYCLRVFSKTY